VSGSSDKHMERAFGTAFVALKDITVTHYIWGLTAQQALAVAYQP
jgi:hypothetical protein